MRATATLGGIMPGYSQPPPPAAGLGSATTRITRLLDRYNPQRNRPLLHPVPFDPGAPARQFDIEQLRTQVVAWDQPPLVYGGANGPVVVWARDDPVLRLLGKYRDERTFREMRRTELKIENSINALISQLLGFGWTLGANPELGSKRRNTPAAQRLMKFSRAAMRPLRDQMQGILRESADLKWDGWVVTQGWMSPGAFTFENKPQWGFDRIQIRPQELFGVTPDRELAWVGYTMTNAIPEVLNGTEEDRLCWHHFTARSTRPYGDSQLSYLWLYWWVKQRCFEYLPRGARNAIQGIPIVREVPGQALMGSAMREGLMDENNLAVMTETLKEAQQMLQFLEEYGILVIRGDLQFENLVNSNFAGEWIKLFYYLDELVQIAIEGQHLTATMGERGGGGRALGDVQAQTKLDNVKSLAREIEQIPNWYMQQMVDVNIGEVDPEDMPWWGFRILGEISVEKAKAFTDLGGILPATPIAEDWGLPETDPEDPGAPVLKLQTPAPLVKTAIDADKGAAPGQRTPEDPVTDSEPGQPTRAQA